MTTETEKIETFIETQRATMFGREYDQLEADEIRLIQTLETQSSLVYHLKFVVLMAITVLIVYLVANAPMTRIEQCQAMHQLAGANVEYVWSFDAGCEAREVQK